MWNRIAWASLAASSLLAVGLAAQGQSVADGAGSDVRMSPISGEPATPRRHYRLADPADLDRDGAENMYAVARGSMKFGYALSGLAAAREYQGWRRFNSAPYLSAAHGNHYLNNYANERAIAYGQFENAGTLPVGSVIAKDSFSVTESGGILLGNLFLMEKMPQGFNPVSGNWKYTLVRPDGSVFGETNGPGSKRVEYCITCHLSREQQDHLYFLPGDYRQ
jgi:hypothetical protein